MAYKQQISEVMCSYLKSVIEDLKSANLLVPGAEEYLIKKYLSDNENNVSVVSSQQSTSVKKPTKAPKKPKVSNEQKSPNPKRIMMGKLLKRIKDEFSDWVDTDVKIMSKSGKSKLTFHQCALGAAEYASQLLFNSSEEDEVDAIKKGMLTFNEKQTVTYFKVDLDSKVDNESVNGEDNYEDDEE